MTAPRPAFAPDALPAIDPITVEVIGSAFASIAEEMGEALVRASHSTNIKERRDCSCALFDADGRTLCQAAHTPIHLGSFISIVPHIMAAHPVAGMRPGDVFIGNDAYEGGGTHLPDIVLAEPIFFQERLVAWAINTAHHADFEDRGHDHIYQEGLRIPPIRLYRAGELQADVQSFFLLNCQVPKERLSDLRAQTAANRLGVLRVQTLCAKYGPALVMAAGAALQDYAERRMRAGIAAIPDGVYRFRDRFDHPELDGDIELAVAVTVRGDEITLAFDSPPQRRGPANVTYTALLATVYYAIKSVVDPTVPPNAGLARPIRVEAREGTVLRCAHPAAVDGRLGVCQRVVDLIFGALEQAVPERVTAAANGACVAAQFIGTRPGDGSTWIYAESIGGGNGARPNKDGLDGVHVHLTNTSNLPVEALEREYPLTLLAYELVEDSAGPGRWRGGMGIRRVYRSEGDCRLRVETTRQTSAPWGLRGGGEGGLSRFAFSRATDHPSTVWMKKGDIAEVVTPGGGGYGPPSERPRGRVLADLAENRISRTAAESIYQVKE
jgi:N-methylhydantoinase B